MKCRKIWCVLLIGIVFISTTFSVHGKSIQKIKIGERVQLKQKGERYISKNNGVVYVSKDGYVTGKQKGNTTIFVKKGEKTVDQIQVQVIKNSKKPDLQVAIDEIEIKDVKIVMKNPVSLDRSEDTQQIETENNEKEEIINDIAQQMTSDTDNKIEASENNENTEEKELNQQTESNIVKTEDKKEETQGTEYEIIITLKNNSQHSVRKIKVEGRIESQPCSLEFYNLKNGQEKTVRKTISLEKKIEKPVFKQDKVRLYLGKMIYEFYNHSKKYSYYYEKKDTVPPKIEGWVGKNSYYENIPYQTVYKGKKYNYFRYVKATDDRDENVKLTVDTSAVNFNKKGTYVITYTAKDRAGNVKTERAKIGVRTYDKADKMADKILKQITKNNWSDEKKAIAIYDYIRKHLTYSTVSRKSSWEDEAIAGFMNKRGDCITYYSMARLLLTRAGIPNFEVVRVKGEGKHWWNMVCINGEFYHYDTCPRRLGGRFCLVTDEQLTNYSKKYGDSHIWAKNKVPKSSTNIISKIFQ